MDNVINALEKNADCNNDVPPLVPRSRLSTLVPTSIRPVAASSLSTSTHNVPSKTPYGLNASHIKNGTVVTSLVTYANSVRDTVEEALTAQQSSIESKLAEIASSLNVLPVLTQKIGNLEAKVDSLETLLNARTMLREQLDKHSLNIETKMSALENSI